LLSEHLLERTLERQITTATVHDVIRTGSERPLPGKGPHQGTRVEFAKKVEARLIVVIAEIVGQDCIVATTYEKE